MAGTWTVGQQPVTWAVPPVIGDGVDRVAEVSTSTQGGDPPALAYEPAAIDESTNYTRSQWLTGSGIDRIDAGEAKFRITAGFGFFGTVDPLLFPNSTTMSHHHTFIGNIGLFESGGLAAVSNADYASLRNNPKSTATGGPLNATLYWEPTLFLELGGGIDLPLKPNVASFYYTNDYSEVTKLYRLLRGMTFIAGVNPADRLNTAYLASIPDGEGWDKTQRYNGWHGWQFYDKTTEAMIPLAVGNTADQYSSNSARQLVNADGSDPWGGAAENPNAVLISTLVGPDLWDGVNFRSPDGRAHVGYSIRKTDNSYSKVGPQNWWHNPAFEVKTEYPASRPGLSGHAYRQKLYLASDRNMMTGELIHPRGSTKHSDWMNGWDSTIQNTWHDQCNGISQNGVAGSPLTCGNSTINATQRMLVTEASPDTAMSNNPVITFHDYTTGATKDACGPLPAGSVISGTVSR